LLARKLLVVFEDNRRIMIPAADVLTVIHADRPPRHVPEDVMEHEHER
jgi:hypothetical protein